MKIHPSVIILYFILFNTQWINTFILHQTQHKSLRANLLEKLLIFYQFRSLHRVYKEFNSVCHLAVVNVNFVALYPILKEVISLKWSPARYRQGQIY
jgi:hypothetical protein